MLHLHWRPHFTTSCLHAAEALSRGLPMVDQPLAEAIAAPSQELARAIAAEPMSGPRLWRYLFGLSATAGSGRELALQALTKTLGRQRAELTLPRLAAAIAGLESAVRRAFPDLIGELDLRMRPLREQWEARGPGMLHGIGLRTDESLIAQEAQVLIVQPALGGGGQAHHSANAVRIEAVLANPHAELPEVVRLAWLLAQLQLDLPAYSDRIHAERLPHVAAFAMLMPVLEAAQEVELVHASPALLKRAIAAWHLSVPADLDAPQVVLQWWETYRDSRPPFPVALTALDQMLL
ncbi:MAG TPA: hypothetical protein VMP01_04535 [Pirellulaceae bacterium]|nr:hypothetical protein [Pirellulaceae bacterium]